MIAFEKFLFLLLTVVFTFAVSKFVKREYLNNKSGSLVKQHRLPHDIVHRVIIAVAQNNLTTLHDMLMERSTPGSSLYQHWLSFEEIGSITKNEDAYFAVMSWLQINGVQVESTAPRLDYITASAPIYIWETLLNTTFYAWKDVRSNSKGRLIYLSEDYSLPITLQGHIVSIMGTCQLMVKRLDKFR